MLTTVDGAEAGIIAPEEFVKRGFRNAHPMADLLDLCPAPKIILDCGAGGGFFSAECDKIFHGATVYSFEPVEKLFKALEFNSLRMVNLRGCSKVALTDINGPAIIYLTANPKSNSLLGFLPGNPLPNDVEVIGTQQVNGIRLDSWMSVNSIKPEDVSILKMDVQGYELKLMDGCPELLKHKPIIYMEVSFTAQYHGQPLVDDVDAYLEARGYRRLYLYASMRPDVWGDAIYVPTAGGEPAPGKPGLKQPYLDEPKSTTKTKNPFKGMLPDGLKINIGNGPTVIDGYIGIDRKDGGEAFPLRFNNGTVVPDECASDLRASHVLEHLSFREVPRALEEWRRVLKPGGRLRIAVPDFGKISSTDRPKEWAYILMGGQIDDDDFHKSVFDETRLRTYLENAGMTGIKKWESSNTDSACLPVSLNLEAFKPEPTAPESLTIAIKAVCSIPRIGWNDFWQSTNDMLNTFGISLETFNGVFWGQCMQRCFQEAVAQGVDWILAMDYDTMANARDLDEMFRVFGEHPEIDALCPLMMRRGSDTPIVTAGQQMEIETGAEPILITTAHFGMTLIRVDALKDVPKPWFISKPDDKGEWGDDRMDDDIWFWHQWRLAGKNIYLAPQVRVGHLQLRVSYFDENNEPQHCHIAEWRKLQLPPPLRKEG